MNSKPIPSAKSRVGLNSPRALAWSGLALVALLTALAIWTGWRYQKSAAWRDHSVAVLAHSGGARLHMTAAESALRGFVILRQKDLRAQYFHEKELALSEVKVLNSLVSDNARQRNLLLTIEPLMAGKFEFSEAVIRYVDQGQNAAGIRAIQEGQGRDLMAAASGYFDQFEDAELELLKSRVQAADAEFTRAGVLIGIGMCLAFILITSHKILLRREIRQNERLVKELRAAEVRATEASVMKSTFLANMSHEIRTPLNGIVGMAKLLETSDLSSEQRDFLETLKISSNSLLALINQILDFSKIESGKLQLEEAPFELYSLLQSTVAIVEYSAMAKNLRVITSIAADVPEFFLGDSLRLRQVLLNLLNNSIKFSDRGAVRLNVVRMKTWDSVVQLAFEVIDEGVGIDPKVATKVFQTFSQGDDSTSRKFGGSGLGLAISKQIVEMMGGQLAFESQPGVGSRFYFDVVLKISKFRADSRPDGAPAISAKSLGAHILVAEDNRVNQKVVAEMMKMLGCTVKIVPNGLDVLTALRFETFDLVLMDGQMPEMDGYEASRRVRQGEAGDDARWIPIIATTANAIKGDIEKCLEAGMNDYISKPISYHDLSFKVEKWLRRGNRLIDEEAMKRLKELERTSGETLLPGLISIFEKETSETLARMAEALSVAQTADVSRAAHSIKSAAANLGAMRVRDIAERLEKNAADAAIVAALRAEFAAALTELKNRPS